jgi:hypothetical protein
MCLLTKSQRLFYLIFNTEVTFYCEAETKLSSNVLYTGNLVHCSNGNKQHHSNCVNIHGLNFTEWK